MYMKNAMFDNKWTKCWMIARKYCTPWLTKIEHFFAKKKQAVEWGWKLLTHNLPSSNEDTVKRLYLKQYQ